MAPPFMDLNQTPTISIDEVTGRRRLDNPLQNLGLLDPSTLIQERGYVDTARTTVQEDLKGLLGNIESKKVSPRISGKVSEELLGDTPNNTEVMPPSAIQQALQRAGKGVNLNNQILSADLISYHESGGSRSPTQKQGDGGPAYGAYQWEPARLHSTVVRAKRLFPDNTAPTWFKKLEKDVKKIPNKNWKNMSKNERSKSRVGMKTALGGLSYEKQRDLFLADVAGKGANLKDVDPNNPDSLANFWASDWHQGKSNVDLFKKHHNIYVTSGKRFPNYLFMDNPPTRKPKIPSIKKAR